jgi:hypothetical protein
VSETEQRLKKAVQSGDFVRAGPLVGAFVAELSVALAGPEGRQTLLAALHLLERLRLSTQAQRAHCERRLATLRDSRRTVASRRGAVEVVG